MKIVRGEIHHLEELVPLFDAYRVFYRQPSDPEGAEAFLEARLHQRDSAIFVARDPILDRIVGFVQLYPLYSSTRMRRLWLLNDLYVFPTHRRKGIAKRLIEACKLLAHQTDAAGLLLETEKDNRESNTLYRSVDFALDTEHNYYFWSNAD